MTEYFTTFTFQFDKGRRLVSVKSGKWKFRANLNPIYHIVDLKDRIKKELESLNYKVLNVEIDTITECVKN